MPNPEVESFIPDSASGEPRSANRRTWIKAAAGLAGGAALASEVQASHRPPVPKDPSQGAGDNIIASDGKNVVETRSGKVQGYWRNGSYL